MPMLKELVDGCSICVHETQFCSRQKVVKGQCYQMFDLDFPCTNRRLIDYKEQSDRSFYNCSDVRMLLYRVQCCYCISLY